MLRPIVALLFVLAACDLRVKRATDTVRTDSTMRGVGMTASSVQRGRVDSLHAPLRIVRHDVIARGSHGMAARVRWLLSPDRLAIIVVEDPAAVEADPVPNGVIFASEQRSALLHIDEVWDAAPSPDWRWLAYAKAYVLRGAHRDTAAAKRWSSLAPRLAERSAGPDAARAASLRRQLERELAASSFPVSGMANLYGAASTHVVLIDSLAIGARDLADTLPPIHLGGWRLRWRRGDTLGIGQRPARVRDDAPATRWDLVVPLVPDSLSATITIVADTSAFATADWASGPTLDISSAIDLSAEKRIETGAARVESRGGMIYLTRSGDATATSVGPGLPLAATANGRYIAAIAPRADRRDNETPTVTVVYEVIPQ